jgi:hypothetical protein
MVGGVEKGRFLEVGVPGGLGGRAMARWVALRDSKQGPSRPPGAGEGKAKRGEENVYFFTSPPVGPHFEVPDQVGFPLTPK